MRPKQNSRLKLIPKIVLSAMSPGISKSRGIWKKLEQKLKHKKYFSRNIYLETQRLIETLIFEEENLLEERVVAFKLDHARRMRELRSLSIELTQGLSLFKEEASELLLEEATFLASRPQVGEIKKLSSYRDFGVLLSRAQYNPKRVYRRREESGAFIGIKREVT